MKLIVLVFIVIKGLFMENIIILFILKYKVILFVDENINFFSYKLFISNFLF